ncbi:uncharacterized protein LOC129301094 [Prosopis cineraria]|uniref:uncharacterized protein LOC129301094 n=1 Tax=Prosopis cineraria TaxID=364024 RepID=UPI00240F37EA|nr:uncharacterized protein LOC129301094 [Prosopis cineraria]
MASSGCVASPPSRNKTTMSRSSSSAFASSSSSFAPRSSTFLTRSSSPTHLSLIGSRLRAPSSSSPSPSTPSTSTSMRFSIDRSTSPRRSMSVTKQTNNAVSSNKRMCMCAPTKHPGSFRCAYHKRLAEQQKNRAASPGLQSSSTSLNLRRSAMKNSLVRIGGVEGELVKRTLTTLIRPSSHQLRRREAFQPRRSRLWMMSYVEVE